MVTLWQDEMQAFDLRLQETMRAQPQGMDIATFAPILLREWTQQWKTITNVLEERDLYAEDKDQPHLTLSPAKSWSPHPQVGESAQKPTDVKHDDSAKEPLTRTQEQRKPVKKSSVPGPRVSEVEATKEAHPKPTQVATTNQLSAQKAKEVVRPTKSKPGQATIPKGPQPKPKPVPEAGAKPDQPPVQKKVAKEPAPPKEQELRQHSVTEDFELTMRQIQSSPLFTNATPSPHTILATMRMPDMQAGMTLSSAGLIQVQRSLTELEQERVETPRQPVKPPTSRKVPGKVYPSSLMGLMASYDQDDLEKSSGEDLPEPPEKVMEDFVGDEKARRNFIRLYHAQMEQRRQERRQTELDDEEIARKIQEGYQQATGKSVKKKSAKKPANKQPRESNVLEPGKRETFTDCPILTITLGQ